MTAVGRFALKSTIKYRVLNPTGRNLKCPFLSRGFEIHCHSFEQFFQSPIVCHPLHRTLLSMSVGMNNLLSGVWKDGIFGLAPFPGTIFFSLTRYNSKQGGVLYWGRRNNM